MGGGERAVDDLTVAGPAVAADQGHTAAAVRWRLGVRLVPSAAQSQ